STMLCSTPSSRRWRPWPKRRSRTFVRCGEEPDDRSFTGAAPPNPISIRLAGARASRRSGASLMTDTAKPPTDTPKIPGKEPIFRHLDDPDMKWQKVRRQRNADGTEGTVIEKWFAFSPDPQYLSLYAIYSPGMIVRRHGHFCPHVVYIMEGGAWFGDRWCPVGTHIELPFGAAFGPIKAG